MALDLVWTTRASDGYNQIINYLIENFTDREVTAFIKESQQFFELLREFPEILQKTNHHKNLL